MKTKPLSDRLWDVYFLIIAIVVLIVSISFFIPGMISEKSDTTSTGGVLLLVAVAVPLLLLCVSKLIIAVRKVIETKGKRNEKFTFWP